MPYHAPEMTADGFAALLILHATPAEMTRAREELAIARGDVCPECGGTDIESNDPSRPSELEYRCQARTCQHTWEAAACTVTLPAACPPLRRR